MSWTTDIDETVAQYVVEKSSGNSPYAALDSVPSKNKLGLASYSFDLRSSHIRGNLVRLRSIDKKGRSIYSNILFIRPASEIMRLFPNPSKSTIKIGPFVAPHATIAVLNPMGQLIKATSQVRENQLEIDISQLKQGKYGLILSVDGEKKVFPFIKQ